MEKIEEIKVDMSLDKLIINETKTNKNTINLNENKEETENNNSNLININTNTNEDPKLSLKKDTENKSEASNDELKELQKGVKEVRIAVIGNVDSGKSTLVGVLTKCVLDDGRGAARQLVFNYEHEKQNGRTSSIAHEIMGFKSSGQVEPNKFNDKKNTSWNNWWYSGLQGLYTH